MVKSDCCKKCCNKIISKKENKPEDIMSLLINNILLIISVIFLLYGIVTNDKGIMIQCVKSVTIILFIATTDLISNNFQRINFSDDRYTFIMGTAIATSIYHMFFEKKINYIM